MICVFRRCSHVPELDADSSEIEALPLSELRATVRLQRPREGTLRSLRKVASGN